MIELKEVSFQYHDCTQGVFKINMSVAKGECVVVTGASGCGKTTLTRLINTLAPTYYPGEKTGAIFVDGQDISDLAQWEVGRLVGSVFQDPKSQFFSSELAGEVAFACENYGLPHNEIHSRTEAAIAEMKLDYIRNIPLDVLSSGEKQRTAIASVFALCPNVFVCDEPTANLDESGISQLKDTLMRLKLGGYTLIIAEHRLAWLNGLADRYIYMEQGRIVREYFPTEIKRLSASERQEKGLRSAVRVSLPDIPCNTNAEAPILHGHRISFKHGKTVIWDGLDIAVIQGRVTAITGNNGAGKTTLALVLSGLYKQSSGKILLHGKKVSRSARRKSIWYCANDTGTQFFTDSVSEELLLNAKKTDELLRKAREILKRMGLSDYKDAHPATLSGGQKQRLAIACGLLSEREILIFDEPTSGLDGKNMMLIASELKCAAENGKAVIVITHDGELMEACCDCRINMG